MHDGDLVLIVRGAWGDIGVEFESGYFVLYKWRDGVEIEREYIMAAFFGCDRLVRQSRSTHPFTLLHRACPDSLEAGTLLGS